MHICTNLIISLNWFCFDFANNWCFEVFCLFVVFLETGSHLTA